MITTNPADHWTAAPATTFNKQKLSIPTKNITEAGYLFVYLSYDNDSNNWVYFDDLKVTHTKTNVIQYNEYYPFGLQTANSWTREDATDNKYLYNGGAELNSTTGWYETFFRGYDATLGRFLQVDPLAHQASSFTPYNYAFNNPVMLNDPMGDYPRAVQIEMERMARDAAGGGGGYSYDPRGGRNKSHWSDQYRRESGGSYLSIGEFLAAASASPYGGSWSNGQGVLFESDEQALAMGIAYNDYHDSWGNTEYGSERATVFAYLWTTATGYAPTTEAVEYHLNPKSQPNFIASSSSRLYDPQTGDPDPWRTTKAALAVALVTSAADGPIPIGEVIGAAVLAGAIAYDLVNQRRQDPEGVQYSLRALTAGLYPDLEWGSGIPKGLVFLNAGDIWKIGETVQYDFKTGNQTRYYQSELISWNVRFVVEFSGSKRAIVAMEGLRLIQYFAQNGSLPPGNKGFK